MTKSTWRDDLRWPPSSWKGGRDQIGIGGRLRRNPQVFGVAHPETVVLTTPNAEYNARYETLDEGALRHVDHRFEWTRREFAGWAQKTAVRFGYRVTFDEIGETDPELGASTQMGVFTCI
jgi:hypothetical protein